MTFRGGSQVDTVDTLPSITWFHRSQVQLSSKHQMKSLAAYPAAICHTHPAPESTEHRTMSQSLG